MPMFRKRPVVIEARQYTADPKSCADICAWADIEHFPNDGCGIDPLTITTLEGDMEAQPGDWIIKGVKGEFYPCKPDIFALTYEPDYSGYNAPFCRSPEKCGPKGRCLSEIACND